MKKIAISQSNYLPWKGYFELINYVDEFIFFDEVQYTRRDWRNRNILLKNGKKIWITLPIKNKNNYKEKISNMIIDDIKWKKNHLDLIKNCYSKSKYFNEIYDFIRNTIQTNHAIKLSEINQNLIKSICDRLDIKNSFSFSSEIVKSKKNASERLLEICKIKNCKIYVTGPNAKNYLNQNLFEKNGIKIEWYNYGITKKYYQINETFQPNLSIIDCLMNCGFNKKKFMNL